MKYAFAIVLISFLSLSCSKDDPETLCTNYELSKTNISPGDDYAVWDVVLSTKAIAPVIIQQEKNELDSSTIYYLKEDTSYIGFEADSTLLNRFIDANKDLQYWGNDFKAQYQLISRDEIDCLFQRKNAGWTDYNKKYPKGFWTLSRPGIYDDHALVQYGYYCGNLCAEGGYFLLKKENGKWIIERQGIAWIS